MTNRAAAVVFAVGFGLKGEDGGLISTFEFSGFIQWLDLDQAAEGANALHSREREREI